jgi:polyhydroxyalkanoate synthase subunit PhaC
MATGNSPPKDQPPGTSPDDWMNLYQSWSRAQGKAMQMMSEFWLKQMQPATHPESFVPPAPGDIPGKLDPLGLQKSFGAVMEKVIADPDRLARLQRAWFDEGMELMQSFMGAVGGTHDLPRIKDKRFAADEWSQNTIFAFLKHSYLLASKYVYELVHGADEVDPRLKAKALFYTKQFLDAASPSNFLLTNPQALAATMQSGGANLVKGMENLLSDLEAGRISMTDYGAFTVGENVATTPGRVVFENKLFQLIQYAPTTAKVYETPILFFPPWINKFYILDLTPEKSMVKWLTDQGFTVLMVSWINPDSSLRDMSFEDYMMDGQITAISAAQKATGAPSFHVVGYCVSGTLLACTLSYLTQSKTVDVIKSATFFTAQVDFEDSGDLRVFVDDEQLKLIDDISKESGLLDASYMSTTFNLLRSNDLVWSYVVSNYLLGKDPFPFDLLYWNADSTRMPRAMHLYYLDTMYNQNKLIEPGAVTLGNVPIDLSKIKVPMYVQAGKEDHIAPAASAYKLTRHLKGPARYLLAGSGHIAGVVNPPSMHKYQYWTNDGKHDGLESFIKGATEHAGSWWPDWVSWLAPQSGKKIAARVPDAGIEAAPGRYVQAK